MRLKTYKMAMSILPKFLTLKWNISRTIWRIEVGDGSFFCIFHALSFELTLFLDRRCPLTTRFERTKEKIHSFSRPQRNHLLKSDFHNDLNWKTAFLVIKAGRGRGRGRGTRSGTSRHLQWTYSNRKTGVMQGLEKHNLTRITNSPAAILIQL